MHYLIPGVMNILTKQSLNFKIIIGIKDHSSLTKVKDITNHPLLKGKSAKYNIFFYNKELKDVKPLSTLGHHVTTYQSLCSVPNMFWN